MPIALIVLAAGQGTRMNSDLPKVMHPLGGVPLFVHALAAGRALDPDPSSWSPATAPTRSRRRRPRFGDDIVFARQAEQLGTGHAVAPGAAGAGGLRGRRRGAVRRYPVSQPRDAGAAGRGAADGRRGGAGLRAAGPGPLRTAGDGRRPAAQDRRMEGRHGGRTPDNVLQLRDQDRLGRDAAQAAAGTEQRQCGGRILPDRHRCTGECKADDLHRHRLRRRRDAGHQHPRRTDARPRRCSRPPPAPGRWTTG